MLADIEWNCRRFEELDTDALYRILQLRSEIFVVEQNCVYQDVDGFDQDGLHVIGEVRTGDSLELLSYSRLLRPGVKYEGASIGRVIAKSSARGSGLGKLLMEKSLHYCRTAWPNTDITISAQQYLEKFYSELGFETDSQPYDEDGIPHVRMQLSA